MDREVFDIILLLIPLLVGGVIAAINSSQTNELVERGETWVRREEKRASSSLSFFSRNLYYPVLWLMVWLCDWTDRFDHRGVKNGIRIAAVLYTVVFVITVLNAAFFLVILVAAIVLGAFLASRLLGWDSADASFYYFTPTSGENVIEQAGQEDQRKFSGQDWLIQEFRGRVDEDGIIYRGSNWVKEERIGRIDEEGNIFEGAFWFSEKQVGRIDKDGTLHKGPGWFTGEQPDRSD